MMKSAENRVRVDASYHWSWTLNGCIYVKWPFQRP
jgi:hypothetical protein